MTSSVVGPSGPRPGVERATEAIEDAIGDLVQWPQIRRAVAERIVAAIPSLPDEATEDLAKLLGAKVEYREAENGSASSFTSSSDGARHGHTTTPTRYRRFVTDWRLDRPSQRFDWSDPAPWSSSASTEPH